MTPSTHQEYLSHLSAQLTIHADNQLFWQQLGSYHEALCILPALSLDPVSDALTALYCSTGQGDPCDPGLMLRSWLLMTLEREGSPTTWATRLRREPVLAILAGFTPGNTPCAMTHRNFLKRLVNGPYAVCAKQDATRSQQRAGRHLHRLDDATKARAAAAKAAGKTQSALLAETLLSQADLPLNPHDLQTRLDHLFVELGLKLTLKTDLLPDTLTAGGDGSNEPSGASDDGYRACDCPPGTRCDCPREYLSNTAQWCYDVRHSWTYGDRSYTISVHVNRHDIPLITILPGGNESDFTLSLKALDRLLKLLEDLENPPRIEMFIGDKHHDAMGIYRYLKAKGIIPIIPLDDPSQPKQAEPAPTTESPAIPLTAPPSAAHGTTVSAPSDTSPAKDTKSADPRDTKKNVTPRPALTMYPHITFESDGTPLCPGGCRMRQHGYNSKKAAHIFVCPCTRKNKAGTTIFYTEECPFQQDCTPPEKKMGHTLYIKAEADLRLFPPIRRDATRFKDLFAHRSGTERQNAVADSYNVDRRHRNAAYTLVRLTFVNICKHARLRETEREKPTSERARLHEALTRLALADRLPD